jgi:hypothetical protein
MNKILPEVSAWYQELVSGALFEVVAIDEVNSTIEYQLLDGEVGEYDLSTWRQLFIPENFSGALLDIEPESLDLGDDFQII